MARWFKRQNVERCDLALVFKEIRRISMSIELLNAAVAQLGTDVAAFQAGEAAAVSAAVASATAVLNTGIDAATAAVQAIDTTVAPAPVAPVVPVAVAPVA